MKKLLFVLLPILMLCSCVPITDKEPEPTTASAMETQPAATAAAIPEPSERSTAEPRSTDAETPETQQPKEETTLKLAINGIPVTVRWEENESVAVLMKLAEQSPLTIRMSMYGGFEQVGQIGQSLPRNDKQITTEAGDIVLYAGNQIVVFYGSNSWAYTRLGQITDKTPQELKELLGNGDVTITISAEVRQ